MRSAFEAAEFDAAADVFDAQNTGTPPIEAVLLRARIYLKKNNAAAARALLESRRVKESSGAIKAEIAILLAAAYARANRFDVADLQFAAADDLLRRVRDTRLAAELTHQRAMRFAIERRLEDARAAVGRLRRFTSGKAQIDAAFDESFIYSSEGRYRDQAAVLQTLLEHTDLNSAGALESRIHATQTLAILCRELYLPDAVSLVERHLDAGPWPSDYDKHRFEALKALGWCHALRGDYFNAFRRLKASQQASSRPELQTMAHLDRAYLARCRNELLWHRQELAEAEDVATRVDWAAAQGEERVALLLLAEQFASIDAGKASYYIGKYDELPPLARPLQHFTHDGRLDALADYSRAVVDMAVGNRKTAVALLKRTQKFYEGISFDWRAGRCALRLFEATGDPVHLKTAEERLHNYMGSWLGDELRRLRSGVTSLDLPPVQKKVFYGICKGLSNAEIAESLGRSEFTVRNHVKILLKRFNVPSRSALIAEAMRRRLI
jgi:DNA-binding CsgD family transcriptional regulator